MLVTLDDHVVPRSACLACGHRMDRAMNASGEGEPRIGDFTVCIRCSSILGLWGLVIKHGWREIAHCAHLPIPEKRFNMKRIERSRNLSENA